MKVCGHKPNPDSFAYGDWHCQRRRWHIGRHRYRNYVWSYLRGWESVKYMPTAEALLPPGAPIALRLRPPTLKLGPLYMQIIRRGVPYYATIPVLRRRGLRVLLLPRNHAFVWGRALNL